MAIVTEKKLKRLKKAQLLHLLIEVMGIDKVDRMWQRNRKTQARLSPRACWDCNIIQARFEEEK